MKSKNFVERHIPIWCRFHKDLTKDNKDCCCCGEPFQAYQQGDGKVIHTLCYNCLYGRIKDKKILKIIYKSKLKGEGK